MNKKSITAEEAQHIGKQLFEVDYLLNFLQNFYDESTSLQQRYMEAVIRAWIQKM